MKINKLNLGEMNPFWGQLPKPNVLPEKRVIIELNWDSGDCDYYEMGWDYPFFLGKGDSFRLSTFLKNETISTNPFIVTEITWCNDSFGIYPIMSMREL